MISTEIVGGRHDGIKVVHSPDVLELPWIYDGVTYWYRYKATDRNGERVFIPDPAWTVAA